MRTILILMIVWLLLRAWVRSQQKPAGPPRGTQWSPPDSRPKGDVRIERAQEAPSGQRRGTVEDADFEEIK
jgi:hypothetical protein